MEENTTPQLQQAVQKKQFNIMSFNSQRMKDKMIAGLGHRRLTGPTTALNYLPHNLDMDGDYCQSKGKQLVTYTQGTHSPSCTSLITRPAHLIHL